jgi:ABC-2 type transport system ATP-binding protein
MGRFSGATAVRDGNALIEVSGYSKRYGEQFTLEGISFAASRGEILGIIGPNGAGKTTLLEAIAGLVAADAGSVRMGGELVPPQHRREWLFYVPDGVRPYQDQFVTQVLSFVAGVYCRNAANIADVVDAVSLQPVLHKRVLALSKGYARRLLLAIGLLTPHPVLAMDEPFDGFDLRQSREIVPLLRGEAARGRTLILSIHQLSDAERICDRFLLIASGRVRGAGTLDELRERAARPGANLEEVFLALT